jgi:hypothetical protein
VEKNGAAPTSSTVNGLTAAARPSFPQAAFPLLAGAAASATSIAMAKALTRFAPRPIIVNMPRRSGRLRRAGARVVHVARRGGRAARRSLPLLSTVAGSGIVGYLVGSGRLDFLPEIGGSKMVALGIAGFALTRMSGNPHVKAAGFAALTAAAFDFGRSQGAGGTHGDDNWAWND